MTYQGTVRNGVVIFETNAKPPDGAEVEVHTVGEHATKHEKPIARRKIFDVDQYVVETGIPDLGLNHDHYLYGLPKVSDGE